MATLIVTITPDVGQSQTATITVSQTDATAIFQAYKALKNTNATLNNLVQYFASIIVVTAQRLVQQNNTVVPPAPTMNQDGNP